MGVRESVEELDHCDMLASSEIAECVLAFCGGQVVEDFGFVGRRVVLCEKTEECFGGWVRLDVCAPSQDGSTGGDKLSRLFLAPHGRPATSGRLQQHRFVTDEFWDGQEVHQFLDHALLVRSHDANCTSDAKVDTGFDGVIGNIEVEMVCSFFSTRPRQLSDTENLCAVYIVRGVGLHEGGRVDACVDVRNGMWRSEVFFLW